MFKRNLTSVLRTFKRNRNFVCNPCLPVIAPCSWTVLPNGIKVISEMACSPLQCLSLSVEVGPRYEVACNHGIAHFIEHLAYKGFSSLPRLQFEANVRCLGGRMNVKTYRDRQVFTVICPSSQNIGVLMNYLAKIFFELDPCESDVSCEKLVIEQEMTDSDNNPKKVVFDLLHKAAFQGTPLARSVIGPSFNIERFDKSFANVYIKENYLPNKFTVSVSGPHDHKDVVCMVQENFGYMKEGCHDSSPSRCRFTSSQALFRDDSMPLLHVALAVEAPGYYGTDYWPLELLRFVIGRWEKGQGGGYNACPDLAQAAAMGDLCYSFEPFYIAYKDVGLWGVHYVCNTTKAEDMLANIQDSFMSLCSIVRESDATRAKDAYNLYLAKNVEGAIKSCKDMGKQMFYKGERKNIIAIGDILDKYSEKLNKVADEYLYDRNPVVAAVGPTEGLPDYSRIAAGMYWLRL